MKNKVIHYYKDMPDTNFSVDIIKCSGCQEVSIGLHWHEHLQLYYIEEGSASLICGSSNIDAPSESLIVINNNEVHSFLQSCSPNIKYYILRIDPSFLFSNPVDICQAKYLSPLFQNLIYFQNLIENDENITKCVKEAIYEYENKAIGYELEIKASVYHLIVLLLRKYIKNIFTQKEFSTRASRLKSLTPIFNYIEKNYAEKITSKSLAKLSNLSLSHFCRIFKWVTGKTVTEYINDYRLDSAVSLLNKSDENITEIALNCGFYDANYFSRAFKKRFKISPKNFRKQND